MPRRTSTSSGRDSRVLAGEVQGNNVGGGSRNRETCHFTNVGGDPLDVYVSLFKGKDNSSGGGRAHQRLVMRYKAGAVAGKGVAIPRDTEEFFVFLHAVGDPCDEEPNEDVLEEEPEPTDLGTMPYLP